MADLLDIAPSTAVEVVKIDGQRVTVRGISVDAIASIVARFPGLKSLASGDGGGDFVLRLIQGCGAAAGPIIAAGCGHLGEEQYEQRAAALLPEQQIKFIRAIFGLTFPNGVAPFVQELTSLIGGGSEEAKPRQGALEDIAIAITAIIRRGFPPDYAMTLTPRQIAAYLEFSDKLDRIERANDLMISALGAQGDGKAIEKTIKELGA